jgi:hypothetical protein
MIRPPQTGNRGVGSAGCVAGLCLAWVYLDTIPDFSFKIFRPGQSLGFATGANGFNDVLTRYVRVRFPDRFNHSPDGIFIKRSVHFFPFIWTAIPGYGVAAPYRRCNATAAPKFSNVLRSIR